MSRSHSSPVIVTGMHCSGTTILRRILQGCGLFMGVERNQQEEATFFRRINRSVLELAGAYWDAPEVFAAALGSPDRRRELGRLIERRVHSVRSAGYWGFVRYLRVRFGASSPGPWGWKDPRNCLTLPLWLSVFPAAKVIHLVRNGADVAESLRGREARRPSSRASKRCLDLDGGFSLWAAYETMLLATFESLPSSRRLELRYETLAESPHDQINLIGEFLGRTVDPRRTRDVIAEVRPDSANAYRNSASLSDFHARNSGHPLMSRFDLNQSGK